MGTIVRFPDGQRPISGGRYVGAHTDPADVIILPVVRIERQPEKPSDGFDDDVSAPGRRKRRRSSRP